MSPRLRVSPSPRLRVSGSRFHYGYVVLALGFLSIMGAGTFPRLAFPLILPGMKDGLGLSYTESGLLAMGIFLGYLAANIPGGLLTVRYGPRRVLAVSGPVTGVASLIIGLAPSFPVALLAGVIAGAGGGAVVLAILTLPATWAVPEQRGRANGILVTGYAGTQIVSGLLVPVVMGSQPAEGWRFAWFWVGLGVVAVGLATAGLVRNQPADVGLKPLGARPDSEPDARPGTGGDARPGLRAGLALLGHRALIILVIFEVVEGFAYAPFATFFAAHMTRQGGISLAEAGQVWTVGGVVGIASGLLWGLLADAFGRRRALILCVVVQATSFLLAAVGTSLPVFLLAGALFSLTSWGMLGVMMAAAADYFGRRLAAAAMGIANTGFGVGQAFGPGLAGVIADATLSFTVPLYLAAALGLVAAGLALLLPSKPAEGVQPCAPSL